MTGYYWDNLGDSLLNEFLWTHAIVLREAIEDWCRHEGIEMEKWPYQREWFGIVDLAVRHRATDVKVRSPGVTNRQAVNQACSELGVDWENLRHRWEYHGRPW